MWGLGNLASSHSITPFLIFMLLPDIYLFFVCIWMSIHFFKYIKKSDI